VNNTHDAINHSTCVVIRNGNRWPRAVLAKARIICPQYNGQGPHVERRNLLGENPGEA
jgi:hypothetical protein